METKTQNIDEEAQVGTSEAAQSKRKRRGSDEDNLRYFLPKAGSSSAKPELGQEMASEGEALIEAFKNGQQFYTLTTWKAVPEVNRKNNPVIVKQALARA
ncbi:MAG TPA: hypothetical protein VKD23_21750 [Terriglobales bacterium]|nr:hypothetical protein [Terriglobales bacterium]